MSVELDYKLDWMGPKLEVLGSIRPYPQVDELAGWWGANTHVAPRFQSYGPKISTAEYAYAGYGYDAGNFGVWSGMYGYDTNPRSGCSVQWTNFAPNGQYLARLEHAREVIEDSPEVEADSLTSILANFRRLLERQAQINESEIVSNLSRRGPGYTVEVIANASPFHEGFDWPFQIEARSGLPTKVTAPPTPAVWDTLAFYADSSHIITALKAESKRRVRRNFFRRLTQTRKLVHRSARVFRGLAWSKRLWHLLHGSHPPKSEGLASCHAFGCA